MESSSCTPSAQSACLRAPPCTLCPLYTCYVCAVEQLPEQKSVQVEWSLLSSPSSQWLLSAEDPWFLFQRDPGRQAAEMHEAVTGRAVHLLQRCCCHELRPGDSLGPDACSVPAGEVLQAGQAALHRRLHGVHPLLQRTRSPSQQPQMLQEPTLVNAGHSSSDGIVAAAWHAAA